MGMITVRSGSTLRVTVTSTVFSVTPVVSGSSLSATVCAALPNLTVTVAGASSFTVTGRSFVRLA